MHFTECKTLTVTHGLADYLREFHKCILLSSPAEALVCCSLSAPSSSPAQGNFECGRAPDKDVAPAEGNNLLSTSEDESKKDRTDKVLMKASVAEEAEVLRLCRNANYAVPPKVRKELQAKPAVNSAQEWIAARC